FCDSLLLITLVLSCAFSFHSTSTFTLLSLRFLISALFSSDLSRNPFAAFAMLLFMLSLGGIPPTAGFMGKFWLFSAAIDAHYYWLALIGVLNSAVSLYYYIRIVVFMYVKKETLGSEPTTSPTLAVVLAVAVAATLVLGVYPQLLFNVAAASARTLGAAGASAALR